MNTLPYNPQVFVPAVTEVNPRLAMIQELEANLGLLAARDQDFAKSLIKAFHQYGLSEKQGYWVVKLLERVDAAKAPAPTAPSTVQLSPEFAKVAELFTRAKEAGLRQPRIRLETDQGTKVVLKLLGSTSKFAGQIAVTSNSSSFENRVYFGRIDMTGTYYPAKAQEDVTRLLQALAADPAHMATLYGHRTGHCCFCGLQLTTSASVHAGYGPICAEKYGLAWGHYDETTYTAISLEDAE